MKRDLLRILGGGVTALVLAAGNHGAPAATVEDRPTANSAADSAIAGLATAPVTSIIGVGGLDVEFRAHRAARPRATLVFENGLMLPLSTWQKIVEAFADDADMLLYNRPGVGRSALSEEPQDAVDTVRRLRELLRAQHMPPPYVLIGHSLGGQYSQLFAHLYPDEVGALLLVDALPPGTLKPTAEFPWYTRLALWAFMPESARREMAQAPAMGEWLLGGSGFPDRPMIRLVAAPDPRAAKPEGLLKDLLNGVVYAEDFGVWAVDPDIAERALDRLYPRSVVREVAAQHRMQELSPAPVIDAIRELIDAGSGAGR